MKSCKSPRGVMPLSIVLVLLVFAPLAVCGAPGARYGQRYGDVVMNKFAEQRGMAPVVFPHSLHRVHFRCNVCHEELGFAMKAGANKIEMANIVQGQYCGACHNGKIAWGSADCNRCHRGWPAP